MWFLRSKWTAHHLPKRLELLLYTVRALPNASSRMPASSVPSTAAPDEPLTSARHVMHSLVVSVLPAPLSPLTRMDCELFSTIIALYALAPTRKMLTGMSSSETPWHASNADIEQTDTGLYGLTAMTTGPIAV